MKIMIILVTYACQKQISVFLILNEKKTERHLWLQIEKSCLASEITMLRIIQESMVVNVQDYMFFLLQIS